MIEASPSWARDAIEAACERAADWYRGLPRFSTRVNLGSVVGFRQPAILSEQDCVINFARFLNEVGVPWDALHHEVSRSRWLFESPHPAAAVKWRVDLALIHSEDLLRADLPATDSRFSFDAVLEFAYMSDSWSLPGAVRYGEPAKSRAKVKRDIEKVAGYLNAGVCRYGYVIVFEEANSEFATDLAAQAEADTDCRVRFIRGYGAGPDD
ncbi:MAG TPA: hypothetical protein VFI09_01120 [Solirubrobacterales bacterium]|nr:hypothetical protein [Solirubrobacterales bacterium]